MVEQHVLVKPSDKGKLLGERWRRLADAGRKKARELPRKPWPPLRASSDHDRVGAGGRKRVHRVVVANDVAIDDDRNRDSALDGTNRRPVRLSGIELTTRSPVHGDEPDAGVLGTAGEFRGVDRAFVPA